MGNIISIIIASLSVIFSSAYNIFHLGYMEKKLLPINERKNLDLSTMGITLLAIVLLLSAWYLTKDWIAIAGLILYLILIVVFYFMNKRQEKNTIIKFNYAGITYVFINRIDDTTISVLPEEEYNKDKANTRIMFFPLSKLSDVEFYTDNKKQKSPTNNQDNTLSSNTISQLLILKELLDKNIISQEEFVAKKKQLLDL
jgi:hypothetical protein